MGVEFILTRIELVVRESRRVGSMGGTSRSSLQVVRSASAPIRRAPTRSCARLQVDAATSTGETGTTFGTAGGKGRVDGHFLGCGGREGLV